MADGRRYSIAVEGVPPTLNARLHHMSRYRANEVYRQEVAWQAQSLVAEHGFHPPFARARVVATIGQRSRRYLLDTDNAYSACKVLVDGLKGRLIRDDRPGDLVLEIRQVLAERRGVTLEITEIVEGEAEA